MKDYALINLGCGTKCAPEAINLDWSIYLTLKRNRIISTVLYPLIGSARREHLASIPDNIIVHDISRGLPFRSNSIDAAYHSHVLEHIDRDKVSAFTKEVLRVLKPGGIHRVAVPDLHRLVERYLETYSLSLTDSEFASAHDRSIAGMYEQSVRRESFGSSRRKPIFRWLENVALGDARKRGETHQWMYDSVNLGCILRESGFVEVKTKAWNISDIPNWQKIGLEVREGGSEYKPGSLYIEARKK